MSENNHGPHLTPPAFPPGIRRHAPYLNSMADESAGADRAAEDAVRSGDPAEAAAAFDGMPLISPDEPLPPRSGAMLDPMAGALISPDEPLPRRAARAHPAPAVSQDPMPGRSDEAEGAGAASANGIDEVIEEGIATGLNDDPHLHAHSHVPLADPHVGALLSALTRLTDELKARGEAGLRVAPQMSAFEATLRAYCTGYLAARRDGDAPALPYDAQGG